MRGKFDKITEKLQDLEKEKTALVLSVIEERPKDKNRKLQTSTVNASSIVGRREEKEALLHKLLLLGDEPYDQNFTIVPIVGMGGVGKTTLAKLLYNEKIVQDHFHVKAWVCVPDEFDAFYISKVIYENVTGVNKEFSSLDLLQVALKEQLMEKRFLLVLDDVWSESYDDWKTLEGSFYTCAPGSKIIMTTRKEKLLAQLGYNHLSCLQSLSHDDAVSLFTQNALDAINFDSHPTLKAHGEAIVKRCDGLPLALIALGRLLRTKKEEEECWEGVLNDEIWSIQDGGVNIIPALRLSYQDLSSRLKQLFAYCSLFPKGYMFEKEELVLLWMAEGFLHHSTAGKLTERLGYEYFEELLSRSFFQKAPNDESVYVMHDLMNELATIVAGDFFFRLDNEMEKGIKKEDCEKYRHMSFIREQYVTYKKFVAFRRATSLRTFLATSVGGVESSRYLYLSSKILVDLLPELPLLRVLCLSKFQINEVPESIGTLRHLRYLNLSQTNITMLPENVCNLYNLQTLIIFGCNSLTKLPNSFLKLKNLRHFDIRDTPLLKKMPLWIGEMKSLQTLSKIIIGGEDGFQINKLKDFKNLCGKISIVGLDNLQNVIHAREAHFLQKRLSELEVKWSDVFDDSRNEELEKEVLTELKPSNKKLKQLKIVSYGGRELPNWVGDPSYASLTHVSILGCKKCACLPPIGELPSLKELFVEGFDGVKVVGLDFLGTRLAFPSLEILSFKKMQGWEIWFTKRSVVEADFPCLKKLILVDCPALVELSLEALPLLRVLEIHTCGDGVLRSLVHVASSITMLHISDISGLRDEVWRGVIKYLGAVEELKIRSCNEIRYLWETESEANKALVNLRILRVFSCSALVSLGEKERDEDICGSNTVTTLMVLSCDNMERCRCPNSIESLSISSCASITSITFPTGRGQNLKLIRIRKCPQLLENRLEEEKMSLLNYAQISLPKLRSITKLNYLIHLSTLHILGCQCMESFPDHELPNLTSLKHLSISSCRQMDASFPRGFWPPNLCTIGLGRLKKPISEWGWQNFPNSLVTLGLYGGLSEEDVTSCSQLSLSDLLPSSLNRIWINDFMKLETLSVGLQHLTSLQYLHIVNCPKMTCLPETLLPSLFSLDIRNCPNLEEMCNRKGSYWPLVTHIPRIQIKTNEI